MKGNWSQKLNGLRGEMGRYLQVNVGHMLHRGKNIYARQLWQEPRIISLITGDTHIIKTKNIKHRKVELWYISCLRPLVSCLEQGQLLEK